MQEIFDYSIFGNTILGYLSALGILLGGMAIVYVFKQYVLSHLRKLAESTETSIDDLLIHQIDKSLVPILYFGAFYVALNTLALSTEFKSGLRIAAIVLVTVLAV